MGRAFGTLTGQGLELSARYVPGGTCDAGEFVEQLKARRERDRLRRSASFGPQRDDFSLDVAGRPAKAYASQGQQRLLALAIKMGELECVAETSRAEPLLLLDDVSSELDPTRTGAVYDFVRQSESQVFVTTTRPDLFVTPTLSLGERRDFVLKGGRFV